MEAGIKDYPSPRMRKCKKKSKYSGRAEAYFKSDDVVADENIDDDNEEIRIAD